MLFVTREGRAGSPQARRVQIVLQVLIVLLLSAPVVAVEMMLPRVYSPEVDVSGWLMSEKLDGVRGYWDGKQLLSKNGNRLYPPEAFVRDWPPFPVEGELWGGRSRFEKTVSIVKKQQPHNGWLQLKFAIFDVPQSDGRFIERMARAIEWLAEHPTPYAYVIPQAKVRDSDHLQQELKRIESLGGEGLIVRRPDTYYKDGRTAEILKVKNYQDAEAKVLAHLPGKGRNQGRLGALLVALDDGTQFKIGSGFRDAEREAPPSIGEVVTFKHYGKYPSGIPRFPSFLRLRRDRNL